MPAADRNEEGVQRVSPRVGLDGAIDLQRLLAGGNEYEPRVLDLLPPERVAALRAEGVRVFRVLTRVSDDKLLSIPQQIRECAAYAEGRDVAGARRADADVRGIVDRVYNFGEQSGFTLFQSPLFQGLLRDAGEPVFDGFIARDSSRLGRDYWDKFATLGLLRRSGKELHILEDGGRFDYEDDMTKVRSWADTWSDSKKKLEEIRKSMRSTERLREEGFPTTSVPFGYASAWHPTLKRRVWQPSEDAPRVRLLFERAAAGSLREQRHGEDVAEGNVAAPPGRVPLSTIAREAGVSRQLAAKVLRNRAYTGGFTWGGKFRAAAPDVVPPLVDVDLFERVQAVLGPRSAVTLDADG